MKKGRSRTTQDIFDDKKSMFIADSRLGRTARVKRGSVLCLLPQNEASALKTIGIFYNQAGTR